MTFFWCIAPVSFNICIDLCHHRRNQDAGWLHPLKNHPGATPLYTVFLHPQLLATIDLFSIAADVPFQECPGKWSHRACV